MPTSHWEDYTQTHFYDLVVGRHRPAVSSVHVDTAQKEDFCPRVLQQDIKVQVLQSETWLPAEHLAMWRVDLLRVDSEVFLESWMKKGN